jgi:hypothetical protein
MFSTACDSASITSIVLKWWPFSFIFNWGNREKKGGWGTVVMLFLVKKFPGEKGSVRQCIVVMQQFFCRQSSEGRGLLLCLRVITINPAIDTSDNPGQEEGDLTKLLTDVDKQLFLISCQKLPQTQYTTPNKRT